MRRILTTLPVGAAVGGVEVKGKTRYRVVNGKKQAGGWGLKSVRIQECVDNSWSFEKCSKFKVVFKD